MKMTISQDVSKALRSTVTLQWDPVTLTDLAGYKVYYNADSSNAPFSGSGAAEGASPFNVTNQTSATLTGLDPSRAYYFAVTAYNSAGVESTFCRQHSKWHGRGDCQCRGQHGSNQSRILPEHLNGVLQSVSSSAPYGYDWNTSQLSNGIYTITAKAYDEAGNESNVAGVSVSVSNTIKRNNNGKNNK